MGELLTAIARDLACAVLLGVLVVVVIRSRRRP
jgi:hypothetical protein